MSKAFFILLSILPLFSVAQNDWSKACLDGWCFYDVPASENSMAATIQITGSTSAISDITSAAGWEILNCTSDSDAQDIRLVCSGDEISCSHLFDNGAEHTVIRLPPECGSAPFAHVTFCGESDDQSMPDRVMSRTMRRDGTTPPVHALSFNVNFDEIPSSQHGDVSMLVFGSTIPGFDGNATTTPAGSRRQSRLVNKRGLIDSLLGDFNKTKSTDLPPINIDQSFNIFNTTLSCSANEEAKLSVDVNAKLNAEVTIGTVLAGSLIPPKIKEFVLFSDVSADLEGGLSIDANIVGQIDTGKIPLFTVGLPGLSIPGILSLGPSFEIDAQALATIDLDVIMDVDLAYSFSDLQLFFPPSDDHPSSAVVTPQDTPLKLSASPNVESNATLEAHLIPTLKFGLEVLGTNADIFLDLDAFAALDLGLAAGASASVDSTGATSASAQVGGCVDINGGVSVNAGSDASFFGLFDANTEIALFSKDFDFFKKCFEESTSDSSSASVTPLATSTTSSLASSISGNVTASDESLETSIPASFQTSESAILSGTSNDTSAGSSTSTATSSDTPPISSVLTGTAVTSDSGVPFSTVISSTPAVASIPASPIRSSVLVVPSTTNSASSHSRTPTVVTMTSASRILTSGAPKVTTIGTNSNNGVTKRGPSLSRKTSAQMTKRDFQCLAPDVAAPVSVVDKKVSGSRLVDYRLSHRFKGD
ncbi:hypothetical protein ACEPAI_2770 [Sanghuangporus weigelae]